MKRTLFNSVMFLCVLAMIAADVALIANAVRVSHTRAPGLPPLIIYTEFPPGYSEVIPSGLTRQEAIDLAWQEYAVAQCHIGERDE